MTDALASKAAGYVEALCGVVPDRHPGSAGNNEAVDMFERVARSFGWDVESQAFDCLEWESGESWIDVAGERVPLRTGPYSLPAEATAQIALVSTVEELEAGDFAGTALVLHGAIAAEQLFPKNFSFYNPESHKRVYAAIERQAPAAIAAVTTRNPAAAGAVYPFPLIEDGDFDVPNAFVDDVTGAALLAYAGVTARVRIDSRRIPARGRALARVESWYSLTSTGARGSRPRSTTPPGPRRCSCWRNCSLSMREL
jgi:aminopeptidase YwaD